MLFSLLLVGLLAQSTSEAVELENAGRFEEALVVYQRLASANPTDHGVRLAIGRLQLRLRHFDRAEPVYRSVALEDPTSVEALLGLADALLGQWRSEEALEVLERAEDVARDHPGVLSRLGRAHEEVGRSSLAVAYLTRAAAASSSPIDRAALERARLLHDHSVELRSFAEQFSGGVPDSRNGELALHYRTTDRLRLTGRGEYQRKLRASDARGGAALQWRATPYTTLTAQALVGPDNVVMPTGDYLGAIDYTYASVSWIGSVRYFDFEGVQVTALSPGVAWRATDRLSFDLRYALSLTDAAGLTSVAKGHTAQLRGSYQARPRVWVNAGYVRGVDDFDHFSLDRVGAFRAHTGSLGVRIDFRSLTSLVGSYERQWRESDTEMDRITVSLVQRF